MFQAVCRFSLIRCLALLCCLWSVRGYGAEAKSSVVDAAAIKKSVQRALPLIQISAAETLLARECFTCHHGAHAALVLNEAWERGFRLERNALENQLERAYGELVEEQPRFKKGFSVSNTTDGPGYALWMLQKAGWESDAITAGAVDFFLTKQETAGNWETSPARPPTVGSPFTVTFLALRALKYYGEEEKVRVARERAEKWLLTHTAEVTEDRVYRLRALHLLGDHADEVTAEAAALRREQRKDGGWAQAAFMESDAYATGTVLSALADTEPEAVLKPDYQAGLNYLLQNQKADGSWFVRKRARSVQPMFESGFPYGQDQFISYSASCWATYVLLKVLPVDKGRSKKPFLRDARKTVSHLRSLAKE